MALNRRRLLTVSAGLVGCLCLASGCIFGTTREYDFPAESMEPTINKGDRIKVFLFGMLDDRTVQRDEIVIFKVPNEDTLFVKRVVGLGGDVLELRENTLYRNGDVVPEEYANYDGQGASKDFGPVTVRHGCVFVLGDNRNRSADSRMFGPIAIEDVKGRVIEVTRSE